MTFLPQDRAAADALWEDNKDTLRKLYISENMTLDQVRGIMAESHNFEATYEFHVSGLQTNSQYERKFKQWKFRKHCKKKDWVTINRVISKRKREGKESEVLMDGALLPLKKVRKEINRNEPTYSLETYSGAPTPKVPEGFMIRTPLASPSPKMPARAMTYTCSSVSTQEMLENMILVPRAVSHPREYESTSFQEPVPLEGEFFWGIDLPFFKFVAFYNSRVGGSHMHNGRLSELYHEKPENSSRILGIKPNSSFPQAETAFESIQTTVLNFVARTTGRSVTRCTSLLLPTMHSIMPKVDIEGPFSVIQTMEQPTEHDKATEMVKFMFFLLSNNLLDMKTNAASEAVISWLRSNEGTKLIENLPMMEGAGFESIAEKLFQSAILAKDLPTVKALLRTGLQPDKQVIRNDYGRRLSPLLLACGSNDIELARCLIKAGADVNGVNVTANNTKTPLIAAIRNSDSELVSLLLEKGAQANRPDSPDFRPLIEAVKFGDIETVQLLLSAGAEVKPKQGSHYTALHAAFYHEEGPELLNQGGVLRVVKLLLKAGVDINSSRGRDPGLDGTTALDMAAYAGFLDIIRLLLSRGAETTDATLFFATRSGITQVVHFLLDAGANINGKTKYGNTALKEAVRTENVQMVEILLRRGATVNDFYYGRAMTPLQEACYIGHVDLVKTLLEAGALVNPRAGEHYPWYDDGADFQGTALQAAAHCGSAELVRVLLNAGANPNALVPEYGEAPLVAAARKKDVCLVTLLLDAGADVNVNQAPSRDEDKTALQYAIEWGNASIIEELLDAGAESSESTDSESVALIAAVKSGDMTQIQNLLDKGVDINSPSAKLDGRTALSAAAGENNLDLVRYLLSIGADSNDSVAILLAVEKRASIEIIRTLLTARLNAYKCVGKKYGGAALQRAIRNKDIERVRVLLDVGVDVNSYVSKGNHGSQEGFDNRIRSGETAFGTAVTEVKDDDLDLVRLLLAAGADPSSIVVASPKQTALILAISTGSLSLIRLLIEAGGLVNAPAVRGLRRTALQAAVEAGNLKLVQLLLSVGTDVNAAPAPYGGVTALQAAAIKGYITVANTLLSHGAHVNAEPAKMLELKPKAAVKLNMKMQ
ncbi:ankyrin repeat-containing domain protein [Cenococcum geophilum]